MDTETLMNSPSGYIRDEESPVVAPAGEDDGARLDLCAPDIREEIKQYLVADYLDKDFGYRLTACRHLGTMNSAFIRAEKTRKLLPQDNTLYMNPDDLVSAGLDKGTRVRVSSRYGSIEVVLKADPSMASGVVSTHHMWGANE